MRIGIIREEKEPADRRVPLTPEQCAYIQGKHEDLRILVQSSSIRCYSDQEYEDWGIPVVDNLSQCDILIGVKEVKISSLLENKTYFFFSHTIKAQPYNKDLMQAFLAKSIQMIDWECLRDETGSRVIAFGKWAGIVGAHNALYAHFQGANSLEIKRANSFKDYDTLTEYYNTLKVSPIKIAVTGSGRVAQGAMEVFEKLKIQKVNEKDFQKETYSFPVYAELEIEDFYVSRKGGKFNKQHFFSNPDQYKIDFKKYSSVADVLVNAIYWDPKAPVFFTLDEMQENDFSIQTIADITCDIKGSIPSTIRPSTIDSPLYYFNKKTGHESTKYNANCITVMAIDNLPNELPRDASKEFGEQFLSQILPEITRKRSKMLDEATITKDGKLTKPYSYLSDFAYNA